MSDTAVAIAAAVATSMIGQNVIPPSDATPAAATKTSPIQDESCTTASLLQYYDDCAEYYDHCDEGAEDTYICVDRVTTSILKAYNQPPTRWMKPTGGRKGDSSIISSASNTPISTPTPSSKHLSLLSITRAAEEDLNTSSGSSSSTSGSPIPLEGDENMSPPSPASSVDSRSDSPVASSESNSTASASPAPATPSFVSSLTPSASITFTPTPTPAPSSFSATAAAVPIKILDLGVGTGLASRPLFSSLSQPRLSVPRRSSLGEPKLYVPAGSIIPEIWGVDLSPNMLKVSDVLPFKYLIAGDLNTRLNDPLTNPYSPLNTAKLSPGYFDCVVCVGTTEFVRDFRHFFSQVRSFLKPSGGLFCGTFPSNQTQTYPGMSWTSIDELTAIAKEEKMTVMEVQQYRGWSVSSEEHVEYIQFMAST